jgi:hypothetical protein
MAADQNHQKYAKDDKEFFVYFHGSELVFLDFELFHRLTFNEGKI